jgi:hypothetical protein
MQTLAPSESTQQRSPIAAVAIAVAVGLVAALAKRYLDFSLGIPGHAGVGWIAVLVCGRLANGRHGMATIAGLSMGVWGVLIGLDHSMVYNTTLYGMAGALLDSGVMLRLPLRHAWGAVTAGVIVHLAKFGFIFANAWMADMIRRVEIYGFLRSLVNHVIFGAAGGLFGWLLWRWGRTLGRRPWFDRAEGHG